MKEAVKLQPSDFELLVAAYRYDPILSRGTMSSRSLIDNGPITASDNEIEASVDRLAAVGWISLEMSKSFRDPTTREMRVKHVFKLTPAGQAAAISQLDAAIDRGLMHRVHNIRWATWGGIAAIAAAIASALAAYLSYLALDN